MTLRKSTIFFILLLLGYFVLQFKGIWLHFPGGIHEWAQADRLALAYGFYDGSMNFFRPTTFSEYPIGRVTGVEFPIQAYLTAFFAQIFGRDSLSVIFRTLDTVVVILCFTIVFRVVFSFTKGFLVSIFPLLFLLLSPVFLFYTCSYLPDAVSASIVLVGLSFYFQTWLQNREDRRKWAILLLGLGSLIKTSSVIYFIGFVFFDFLLQLKKNGKRGFMSVKQLKSFWLPALLSALLIVFYFFYNQYLNSQTQSEVFLLRPFPTTLENFKYLWKVRIPEVWAKEYFVLPTYIIFLLVFISLWLKKLKRVDFYFLLLLLILSLGILGVSYIMGGQFIDHDYYVIAIFFPFIFCLVFGWVLKYKSLFENKWFSGIVIVLAFLLLTQTYFQLQDRYSPNYPGFSEYYRTFWMESGAEKLDKLNISQQEKIGVFKEDAPNLALLYFDRTGYNLRFRNWQEQFGNAFHFFRERQLKYGVCSAIDWDELTQKDTSYSNYFFVKYRDDRMVLVEVVR